MSMTSYAQNREELERELAYFRVSKRVGDVATSMGARATRFLARKRKD